MTSAITSAMTRLPATQSIPAFYINLDSRTDRRAHFEAELARAGLVAERVRATTPADIAPDRLAAAAARGRLAPTELACSLSHRHIWTLMLERGLPAALVLEDDALLSDRLPAVLADPHLLARGFDAIQFETHRSTAVLGPAEPTIEPGVQLRRLMSSSLGTCAYLISAGLAARLLARADLDDYAVDRLLFSRDGDTLYHARIYQADPALAVQLTMFDKVSEAARSDITTERRHRFATRPQRTSWLQKRFDKLKGNLRHAVRFVSAFRGKELWGARNVVVQPSPDLLQRANTEANQNDTRA